MINIALDVMGGDYAPTEMVIGGLEALKKDDKFVITMLGDENSINEILQKYNYDKNRIKVIHTTEYISTSEPPVNAIRTKKDSSMVVGLKMVRNKEANAFISAGNSGAVLVGGQVIVGKNKGIKRAPLAPLIPTEKGVSLLIDCGANVDARSDHLLQFAKMGSIYMKEVMKIENPTVAIVNIGAEEEKGNALVKETFPLLKECKEINFIGSIEARDIPKSKADVIVCEAFVGNVILKLYEGVGQTLLAKIKEAFFRNAISKVGALLVKGSLKKTLKTFDITEYGGAPLLGLKGIVIKTHGSAKSKEICNTIIQATNYHFDNINDKINSSFLEE